MNRHINLLLQIQDLEIALHENEVLHKDKNHTVIRERLRESIAGLIKNLPSEITAITERISGRYDIWVSPMVNDSCTGCYMKLPVGITNEVKSDHQWVCCPNCNRFLYFDYLIERPPEQEQHLHYKGVAKFSSPELMFPEIQAEEKEVAIAEIGKKSVATGFVESETAFMNGLIEREGLVSTAVGHNIAFPHARGVRACGLTLAVGISAEGIDFGEGEKVFLIFVSAVPTQTSMFYIELVSKLARYFDKAENLQKMRNCQTPDEMWKLMVKIGK